MPKEYENFQDVKTRLDEIVDAVSDDSLSLDELLPLYEEAVKLGSRASELIEQAQEDFNAAAGEGVAGEGVAGEGAGDDEGAGAAASEGAEAGTGASEDSAAESASPATDEAAESAAHTGESHLG